MWHALVLISAFVLSFFDISRKAAVRDNPVWPVLAFSNCCGAIFVAVVYFASGWLGDAVAIPARNWWLLLLKSCIVTIEWSCAFYALKKLPISSCVPVNASSPLWTILGAMFVFHEIPTLRQGIGMAVIVAGYWIFAVAGKAEGIDIFRNKGIALCLFGVIAGATSSLFDKYLLQSCGITPEQMQFWFTVDMAVLATVISSGLALSHRADRGTMADKFEFRYVMLAIGVFLAISDLLYFKAVATPGAMISIVALLRRLNVVFTFILGAVLFHERNIKSKAFALVVIVIGANLLSL